MTLELIDTRFGRKGYPKCIEYTESDIPERWSKQWAHKGALDSQFYTNETNKTFTYNLNSQGYREQEWNQIDWNDSIICLGCSHMFGVGVELEQTIPYKLSKKINVKCINLGIPGGSNFFSSINSAKLINYDIKPRAVVFQKTYKHRWFAIENDTLQTVTATDKNSAHLFPNNEYSNFLDNNITEIIHSQWKNICPIIEFNMEMFDDHISKKYIARDGAHWNGLYFEKIVNSIINTI